MRGAKKLVFVRDSAAVFQRYAEVSGLLVRDDRAGVTIGFQKVPDHLVERDGIRAGPDQPCGSMVPRPLRWRLRDLSRPLASCPQTRRGQFYCVLVGIAEVKARCAWGPSNPTFDGDVQFFESPFPLIQFVGRDTEADVQWSSAVVCGNNSSIELRWLNRTAAQKEQEHLIVGDPQRAEAVVATENRARKQPGIELDRAREVVHIERGFGAVSWFKHMKGVSGIHGQGFHFWTGIAIGLIGEPLAPRSFKEAAMKANS